MANTNNNGARRVHVSPGVYTSETDLTYASKSLGITTLGVAGETLKGPAFQPILIKNWREYQSYFGGTSTEKFRGSQYPKYELPYIAKSYLENSDQLQVVRVLGLSGVNAGPAWVITASAEGDYDDMVIGVLRSRGEHKKAVLKNAADPDKGICEDEYEYDGLLYYAQSVTLEESKSLTNGDGCKPTYGTEEGSFDVNSNNYGRFTIVVTDYLGNEHKYPVSLNAGESNYIYNVIGGDPEKGDAEVYVEELYDVALRQLVDNGTITGINENLVEYPVKYVLPEHAPVADLLTLDESSLRTAHVGQRFLYSSRYSTIDGQPIKVHERKDDGTYEAINGKVGYIYTVIAYTDMEGKRNYYYYSKPLEDSKDGEEIVTQSNDATVYKTAVYCEADQSYYKYTDGDVYPITIDMNNYKEQYRCASTPWVVSELKGSANNVELTKLFRFHTISDGNAANTEIKISIANIDPDNGTFDVIVRDFYDTDDAIVAYERYKGVNLVPGSQNYIGYVIGTSDETYEVKSRYIMVEINENDKTATSIPCGFLGYPIRNYEGVGVFDDTENKPSQPYMAFNTSVDPDVRINRQYFGISDITGIDEDFFKYKGVEAYDGDPNGLTPSFHLDARIISGKPDKNGEITEKDGTVTQIVTVDGIKGYTWTTVGKGKANQTMFGIEPRIGRGGDMNGTIYEDKAYRKFTFCFYGGFDGWDYYRTSRSTGDDMRYTKYRGDINKESGEGTSISVLKNADAYGFEYGTKALTSDFYAYLAGIRQFANPKMIDINVLATPGIDYVNNNFLVGEVIDMVENERADSVYVVTTPDKPFGAGDSEGEMYSPQEAVWNLDDSEIDSNYTCSYYPWVKYKDTANNAYIYLPPTRDVVKNFAFTDNTSYPWFAAAGWNRGDCNGERPRKTLKLSEQDTLYDGRLNFINRFAQEGMKIWGDKNMQVRESQMNRISKRRLLLHIRKLCAIAAIGILFDPNDNTTKQTFESAITPILDNVMANRGIHDWRLEIDDSQEARDRLELPAKIYIKPVPNVEYIDINFVITPSGVSFDDI